MKKKTMPALRDPGFQPFPPPKHFLEAAQSVLCGLLIDHAAWNKIIDILDESDILMSETLVRRISALPESGVQIPCAIISCTLCTYKGLNKKAASVIAPPCRTTVRSAAARLTSRFL